MSQIKILDLREDKIGNIDDAFEVYQSIEQAQENSIDLVLVNMGQDIPKDFSGVLTIFWGGEVDFSAAQRSIFLAEEFKLNDYHAFSNSEDYKTREFSTRYSFPIMNTIDLGFHFDMMAIKAKDNGFAPLRVIQSILNFLNLIDYSNKKNLEVECSFACHADEMLLSLNIDQDVKIDYSLIPQRFQGASKICIYNKKSNGFLFSWAPNYKTLRQFQVLDEVLPELVLTADKGLTPIENIDPVEMTGKDEILKEDIVSFFTKICGSEDCEENIKNIIKENKGNLIPEFLKSFEKEGYLKDLSTLKLKTEKLTQIYDQILENKNQEEKDQELKEVEEFLNQFTSRQASEIEDDILKVKSLDIETKVEDKKNNYNSQIENLQATIARKDKEILDLKGRSRIDFSGKSDSQLVEEVKIRTQALEIAKDKIKELIDKRNNLQDSLSAEILSLKKEIEETKRAVNASNVVEETPEQVITIKADEGPAGIINLGSDNQSELGQKNQILLKKLDDLTADNAETHRKLVMTQANCTKFEEEKKQLFIENQKLKDNVIGIETKLTSRFEKEISLKLKEIERLKKLNEKAADDLRKVKKAPVKPQVADKKYERLYFKLTEDNKAMNLEVAKFKKESLVAKTELKTVNNQLKNTMAELERIKKIRKAG